MTTVVSSGDPSDPDVDGNGAKAKSRAQLRESKHGGWRGSIMKGRLNTKDATMHM